MGLPFRNENELVKFPGGTSLYQDPGSLDPSCKFILYVPHFLILALQKARHTGEIRGRSLLAADVYAFSLVMLEVLYFYVHQRYSQEVCSISFILPILTSHNWSSYGSKGITQSWMTLPRNCYPFL